MMSRRAMVLAVALLLVAGRALAAAPDPSGDVPEGSPRAAIDLTSAEGVRVVKGAWRTHGTKIVEVMHRAPGPDGQPTGDPIRTWDYTPHAGGADFDDSTWGVIDPSSLALRRATGRLCFQWYRIEITVPDRIGEFDPTGATVVFQTTLDDHAEIWVDGELPRAPGQRGGAMIAGWNAANRLVVARDAKPGQRIQLAIFAINGPISDPPANFIWMREARLEFHAGGPRGPRAIAPSEVNFTIDRRDPGLDAIVPPNPKIFKVADGFTFTEGPVWVRGGNHLLFSDPNENRIYKYDSDGRLSVFRERSGYAGADIAEYGQPGSNGLALDREGRLTIDQHGERRVIRLEKDGRATVIADRYEGKRLNSPNDLVYRSDGSLYFTDPPFGLPRFQDDPRKELAWSGVFRVSPDGRIALLDKGLGGPNGIALSPDEKHLYVGNWDEKRKIVMRYDVAPDGSASKGEVFFDMTAAPGGDALDGLKVDQRGNLYVSGPGGLWILSPGGKHLGTIKPPRHPHNFAWGAEDGRTLYMTCRSGLYRMRLNIPGVRP